VEHDPEAWVFKRDPNQNCEQSDIRSFFQSKLPNLPPFQKEAIEFAFYKGMSQREIAIHTEIPLGTIKTRIDLGLKKLSISLKALSITKLESV
jgi:RNA polymerase sigma-70 factor (ECF subfamily)